MRRAGSGAGSAIAEAVAAAVLWGSIGVVYRLGVSRGADPSWLILGRPLAASVFSLASMAAGARPNRWSVAVGLLGLAPLYVSYFLAVERIGAAFASILLYTAPIWVTLLSPLIGDPVRPSGLAAAAAGLVGVALLSSPRGGLDGVGLVLGLSSGIGYALYILLARLGQKSGSSVEQVSVHAFPFAAAAVASVVRPSRLPGLVDAAFIIYLAVAGTIAPYLLNARALARLEASRVAVISLVEPLTATLLAALILGEKLAGLQLLGATLVLASSVAAALPRKRG